MGRAGTALGRLAVAAALLAGGCAWVRGERIEFVRAARPAAREHTVVVYADHTIPARTGISRGAYTRVAGYRHVNVFVEFQQETAGEEPVSLGVVFAHDPDGHWGARRYFTFEENFAEAHPQMITVSGRGSWHGAQWRRSSYIARLPVMGPYLQVFPFNHHDAPRRLSVVLYLTD